MSNKNKRVGICLMAIAACMVLAGFWAILATPETALAKKPGGGDGDTGTAPVCIDFGLGGGVQSDDGTPYCDDKRLKIEAIMTQDGHINLRPNTGRGEGRTLYVDVDFDPLDPGIEIISTEGWRFLLGGWQDNFDMREMNVGDTRPDVGLMINLAAPLNEDDIVYWRLIFDPFFPMWDVDYSDSTYVTVTRTDEDTWTIEVDETDRAVLVLQKQVKSKSEFYRLEDLVTVPPFTATVTLVP